VQDRGDGVGVGGEDRDVDGVTSARGVAPLRIRDRRWAARLPGVAHTTEPPPWTSSEFALVWSGREDSLAGDREAQMSRVTVNGAEFYFEVRGMGPPVLLIMGATGDGGHFDAFADLLADEFTVVSYDRRGNGRSPVPAGWQTTSPEEQADDAAALLEALETGPAAVFGTSSGGTFALCLLVRHPAWVRGAILHEPGLYALVDFAAVRAPLRALVQEAMERGGPPAAVERFWCYVAGDDGWNRLTPALRERLRATASTLFEVELGSYELYLPDEETLAALSAPMSLLVSEDGLPFSPEITGRLGKRLGVEVATTPGTHAAYHDHPYELAEAVRPFLREVTA
jgi:pimeloyl-ACP methyl ester carboxylesterase